MAETTGGWQGLYDYMGEPLAKQPDRLHAGTNAILITADRQVLLQRRADNGAWALPGGGMEIGERAEQCAVREMWEETGLQVKVKRLVGVYSDPQNFCILRYPDGYTVHYVIMLFEVEQTGGELQISDESTDLRFFPADQLPEGTARSARIRIADALTGQVEAFYK